MINCIYYLERTEEDKKMVQYMASLEKQTNLIKKRFNETDMDEKFNRVLHYFNYQEPPIIPYKLVKPIVNIMATGKKDKYLASKLKPLIARLPDRNLYLLKNLIHLCTVFNEYERQNGMNKFALAYRISVNIIRWDEYQTKRTDPDALNFQSFAYLLIDNYKMIFKVRDDDNTNKGTI